MNPSSEEGGKEHVYVYTNVCMYVCMCTVCNNGLDEESKNFIIEVDVTDTVELSQRPAE